MISGQVVGRELNGAPRLSSQHFNKIFEKTKNNLFKDIEYIQTCVRHATGIGEAINIDFRAPISKGDTEIKYLDRYEFVDELKMLRQGKFKEYANHQCLKMCQYLKKTRGIEILSMSAEFLKDDMKNVWFSFANKIQYRRGKHSSSMADIEGGMSSE